MYEFDFAQISGTFEVVNGFTIIIENIRILDMQGHISRGRAGKTICGKKILEVLLRIPVYSQYLYCFLVISHKEYFIVTY